MEFCSYFRFQILVVGATVTEAGKFVGQQFTAHFLFGHLGDALAARGILAALDAAGRLLCLGLVEDPCLELVQAHWRDSADTFPAFLIIRKVSLTCSGLVQESE